MAMLADRRQRKQYILAPRGKALYNDKSRFGTKMLEKMGWSPGKGLGAHENGPREFVRIKYKNDSIGLGFEDRNDQWTQHDKNFSDLLKNLNNEPKIQNELNLTNITKDFGVKSLEKKSHSSRSRVHYKKFTKNKDLSQYSEKDLANIFGKKSILETEELNQIGFSNPTKEIWKKHTKQEEGANTDMKLIDNNISAKEAKSTESINSEDNTSLTQQGKTLFSDTKSIKKGTSQKITKNERRNSTVLDDEISVRSRKSKKKCNLFVETNYENSFSIPKDTENNKIKQDDTLTKPKKHKIDCSDIEQTANEYVKKKKCKKNKSKNVDTIAENFIGTSDTEQKKSSIVTNPSIILDEQILTDEISNRTDIPNYHKSKKIKHIPKKDSDVSENDKSKNIDTITCQNKESDDYVCQNKIENYLRLDQSNTDIKENDNENKFTEDCNSFLNSYEIDTYAAEKFYFTDLSGFCGSNLKFILGYGLEENLQIKIISGTQRNPDRLWDGASKYGSLNKKRYLKRFRKKNVFICI